MYGRLQLIHLVKNFGNTGADLSGNGTASTNLVK